MIRIILDGQYGSCGKGAYCAWLAWEEPPKVAVRTGAPNAGHSIHIGDNRFVIALRHIPAACINPDVEFLVIPAGALIDIDVLIKEIKTLEAFGINIKDRLWIDPRATVITKFDKAEEKDLIEKIGSTGEGVGSTRAQRAMRTAIKINKLTHSDVEDEIDECIREPYWLGDRCKKDLVHVEMTQGFGLSREFGHYPYVTSENIVPAQALVEMGVNVWDIKVDMLMRTYPIRVAGNSGPLENEITWEELRKRTKGYVNEEKTTVTGKTRRVGEWDARWARHAEKIVNPNRIILTFGDYIYPRIGREIDKSINQDGKRWHQMQESYENQLIDLLTCGESLDIYKKSFKGKIHAVSFGFGCIVRTPDWEAN